MQWRIYITFVRGNKIFVAIVIIYQLLNANLGHDEWLTFWWSLITMMNKLFITYFGSTAKGWTWLHVTY